MVMSTVSQCSIRMQEVDRRQLRNEIIYKLKKVRLFRLWCSLILFRYDVELLGYANAFLHYMLFRSVRDESCRKEVEKGKEDDVHRMSAIIFVFFTSPFSPFSLSRTCNLSVVFLVTLPSPTPSLICRFLQGRLTLLKKEREEGGRKGEREMVRSCLFHFLFQYNRRFFLPPLHLGVGKARKRLACQEEGKGRQWLHYYDLCASAAGNGRK